MLITLVLNFLSLLCWVCAPLLLVLRCKPISQRNKTCLSVRATSVYTVRFFEEILLCPGWSESTLIWTFHVAPLLPQICGGWDAGRAISCQCSCVLYTFIYLHLLFFAAGCKANCPSGIVKISLILQWVRINWSLKSGLCIIRLFTSYNRLFWSWYSVQHEFLWPSTNYQVNQFLNIPGLTLKLHHNEKSFILWAGPKGCKYIFFF